MGNPDRFSNHQAQKVYDTCELLYEGPAKAQKLIPGLLVWTPAKQPSPTGPLLACHLISRSWVPYLKVFHTARSWVSLVAQKVKLLSAPEFRRLHCSSISLLTYPAKSERPSGVLELLPLVWESRWRCRLLVWVWHRTSFCRHVGEWTCGEEVSFELSGPLPFK